MREKNVNVFLILSSILINLLFSTKFTIALPEEIRIGELVSIEIYLFI